jgi:integrase
MAGAWLSEGVRRQDDNAQLRRSFEKDLFPVAGEMPVRLLTDAHIRAVLLAIISRGANRTAVIMRNSLMQMFAWAGKRQPWRKLLVEGNPVELVDIDNLLDQDYDPTNERTRVLSAAEVKELHQKFTSMQDDYDNAKDKRLAKQPMAHTTRIAIWIMLGTMCRIRELTLAQWKDIDLKERTWLIPKTNVKGKTSMLLVYLSDFVLAQFNELHRYTWGTDYCFPARSGEGTLDPKSITKQIGDRQFMLKNRKPGKNRRADNTLVLAQGKDGDWTPHDLRRTGATIMQSLKVDLMTIDRCQNHVLPGSKTRRHYLHYDYASEKQAAWDTLGKHIEKIIAKKPRQWWDAAR